MHSVDTMIIGQGLAGSLLAYALIKRGRTVMVIDNSFEASATKVAAGLINPITGHRLNITDRFFSHAESAKALYRQIEYDLNCSVYHELKQTRLIKNQGQAMYLEQRKQQTEYASLQHNISDTGDWFQISDQYEYGGINVSQTAMVDTAQLLYCMKDWLKARSSLRTLRLDYNLLNVSGDGFSYQGAKAKEIVFCEGFQAIYNPWLSQLPFKLSKGEILTVTPSCDLDRMLSWGHWLVPQNNGNARLGSNYIWNDVSLNASEQTASSLLASLQQFTGLSADLVSHDVGVRPTTTQQKPFVGPIKKLDGAYCLNGLGSKGCLIAPHYVDLLCKHLLDDQKLPQETTQWL